jgi:hypothetical protein
MSAPKSGIKGELRRRSLVKKNVPPAAKFRRYRTMLHANPDFAALNPGYETRI